MMPNGALLLTAHFGARQQNAGALGCLPYEDDS